MPAAKAFYYIPGLASRIWPMCLQAVQQSQPSGHLAAALSGRLRQFARHSREHGVRSAFRQAGAFVGRRLTNATPNSAATGLAEAGPKAIFTAMNKVALDTFLSCGATLRFPPCDASRISVILVLYNRAELTLNCLQSLLASQTPGLEVILVNNASTDQTPALLSRIQGVRVIHNSHNEGYGAAVNQAAAVATGRLLLLLNNDTQVLGNSIEVAAQLLTNQSDVGAVGGRIILLDGQLQEAGCICWQDGSALGYGRGDDPQAPPYMFQRDVDFCSGAFLLTPRQVFLDHKGFDPAFQPAYFEDVDYCLRLWRDGLRVVYHPQVALLHYEYASSGSASSAHQLMREKQAVLVSKHHDSLKQQLPAHPRNIVRARTRDKHAPRILFVDEHLPNGSIGAGFPRANRLVAEMSQLGYQVTVFPLHSRAPADPSDHLRAHGPYGDWSFNYRDLPQVVELIAHGSRQCFMKFLMERKDYFDLVYVSRPTVMSLLRQRLVPNPGCLGRARVIYDAEAIFCMRDIKRIEVLGQPLKQAEIDQRLKAEIAVTDGCASIVSICDREAAQFRDHVDCPVYTVGHAIDLRPGIQTFEQRQGLLFVGPVYGNDSPNGDSLEWFLSGVVPKLHLADGRRLTLSAAGTWCPGFPHRSVPTDQVSALGRVDDLIPVYEAARVFVAPTRFSAGIPLKAYEAAAHGVPIVATSLIASQLGWRNGEHLLVADTPEDFAAACVRLHEHQPLWNHIRQNALEITRRECAAERFRGNLQRALSETLSSAASRNGQRLVAA